MIFVTNAIFKYWNYSLIEIVEPSTSIEFNICRIELSKSTREYTLNFISMNLIKSKLGSFKQNIQFVFIKFRKKLIKKIKIKITCFSKKLYYQLYLLKKSNISHELKAERNLQLYLKNYQFYLFI
jgi:hypothetical protein